MKQVLVSEAILKALKEAGSKVDPEIERIMIERWPAIEAKIVDTLHRGRMFVPDVTPLAGLPEGSEGAVIAFIRKRLPDTATVKANKRFERPVIEIRFKQDVEESVPEPKAQRAA